MDIILNGQPHQLTNVQTLQQLVASLELSGKAIAVAVNRRVVASTQWETTQLNAQDTVDVVRAIGGG
jgi:sulfur carrier protein